MELDQARLEAFIHQFAGDFGAALHASTVVVGDKLGLYRALAEIGPTDAADLAAATDCDPRLVAGVARAQYVSGYCQYSPDTGHLLAHPRAGRRARRSDAPGAFLVGAMTIAIGAAKDEEKVRQAFTERQRPRLARAPPRPLPRHRAAVQARLRREPRLGVDPRPRRRRRQAAAWRHRRRSRLRARRLGHPARPGVPEHHHRRLRLPPAVDRRRPQARHRSRRRRPCQLRGRHRPGLPRRAATTSSASSMRSTTWATRPQPPATSAGKLGRRRNLAARRTDGGRDASRPTSIPSVGSSTPGPRSSARPAHRHNPAATPSATRSPTPNSPRSSPTPASAGSGERPRPRSTGCSKRDPERRPPKTRWPRRPIGTNGLENSAVARPFVRDGVHAPHTSAGQAALRTSAATLWVVARRA